MWRPLQDGQTPRPCRRRPRRTPGRSPCSEHGRIRSSGCRTRDSRGVRPRRVPARAARRLPAVLASSINELPTLGDGRQSGTSASPSILNSSPGAFAGGGLATLQTGDQVRIDLNTRRVDTLVEPTEWLARPSVPFDTKPVSDTPWQELYRRDVGPLHQGACLDFACHYRDVCRTLPRHNHEWSNASIRSAKAQLP